MRWVRRAALLLLALLALLLIAAFMADTRWGHSFIEHRIEALRPKSGLVIGIGQINGSIYGKTEITGLSLSDPKGKFLDVPNAKLDWRPFAWVSNRLDIRALEADEATLLRLPKLNPSQRKGAILPDFDVEIGQFAIKTLKIAKGVAGEARQGKVSGKASLHDGRALADVVADLGAGETANILLDAAPDADKFDLDAKVAAPAGGVFGALVGTQRPFTLAISGDGKWRDWKGQAQADVSGVRTATLALSMRDGAFGLNGTVFPGKLTTGRVQRLTSPQVRVAGEGRFAQRRLTGQWRAVSDAINADAKGTIDLAAGAFDNLEIGARLIKPQALFLNMGGTGLSLNARLDGPFERARFEYRLRSQRLSFNETGFEDVDASGRGQLGPAPVQLPVKLFARRVTGVGDVAGGILSNLRAEGLLLVTRKTLTGDGLLVRSDKFNGRISLLVDLTDGSYDVGVQGALERFHVPGLGIVDVKTNLKVVPSSTGQGSRVLGTGQAWVRQWENGFLASLAGGLPTVQTGLERGPDGILYLRNLRLTSPALTLTGNGLRRRDGTFHFEGSGRQARYGALALVLEGDIARPVLDIRLDRPADGMGLAAVKLHLEPDAAGFGWQASGQSMLGPFEGTGNILLPKGGQAVIDIAALRVSGMTAKGRIIPRTGGLEGNLALSGGGINGTLDLRPQGNIQRIDAKIDARNARFEGPPVIMAKRARFDGSILLDPAGVKVDGTLTGEGLSRGSWQLARLAANLKMSGEDGEIRASFSGARGRSFDLQTVARGKAGRWQIEGSGTVDRKPVKLLQTANLSRQGGGWKLDPVDLGYLGGKARLSGLFGGDSSAFRAELAGMPLAIADLVSPGLGLGGVATGTVDYSFQRGGAPSGKADVRVRGLTRSGLVLSSAPVDVGIVAQLGETSAGLRAIAVSGGKEIGRAQLRLTPGGGPDLMTRLARAPVFGQLRYSGSADTLWRLTGVDAIDISGPLSVAADVTGRVDDPAIRGSLRTSNARLESPLTGTVLTQVQASGRFGGGSRFILDSLTGKAANGGAVSATGEIDLASTRGFAMDLRITAKDARLIDRDEIAASMTGDLRLFSENGEGVISGDLLLDKSRYVLGRTTAVASVPRLKVREINRPDEARLSAVAIAMPWRLAIKARAPSRMAVTGMGLDSEWSARLDIKGSPYAPVIIGNAEMLRGDYDFAGRQFELKRGVIRFQGEVPADPALDITAEGSTQGLTASIRVTGTGQKPQIRFTSVPSLPEDELLSRMLFGTSLANLSAPEALQLASAVGALQGGGDGLSPINALRKAVGLDRLRILPADSVTGQGTSVSAGKYITRRAYVEVVTDGQGYSATRAEFQVTRWISILSTISSIGRQSASVRLSKDY